MRLSSLTALVAASTSLIGVSAGPLWNRQETTTSSTPSPAATALVVSTLSDGKTTTVAVAAPIPSTTAATDSSAASTGTSAKSTDGSSATTTASETKKETETSKTESDAAARTTAAGPPTTQFPVCHDGKPFCLPNDGTTLEVDGTYYVTWDANFFPTNSTVIVKLQPTNDTTKEVWTSDERDTSWGFTSITMTKQMLQGYDKFNLTFFAVNHIASDPTRNAEPYAGPYITLGKAGAKHYPPPPKNKLDKTGLMIGLPVSLGFVVIVVIGLWLGMRKHRTIGIGNIMGKRKGYGTGKSKRQRMGLGKGGAIRLQEQELRAPPVPSYTDDERNARGAHLRGDSLGSLVSEDEGVRARGNQFQDEIQRQRTGR